MGSSGIEFDKTSQQDCELFSNSNLFPESVENVEVISFSSFCHKYDEPQETYWVVGDAGKSCLDVCTSMDMVTDSFEAPTDKMIFAETIITYTATSSEESSQPISEFCTSVSDIKSWNAPEVDGDGTCFWDSRHSEPDAFSTQEPDENTRRFCPCVGLSQRRKLNAVGSTEQNKDIGTSIRARVLSKTNETNTGWKVRVSILVLAVILLAALAIIYSNLKEEHICSTAYISEEHMPIDKL